MFVSLLPRLTLFAEPEQLDEVDLLGLTFSYWAGALRSKSIIVFTDVENCSINSMKLNISRMVEKWSTHLFFVSMSHRDNARLFSHAHT